MSTIPPQTVELTAPQPGDTWLRVSDGLLSGLHHALNNRMAALGAVIQVLEAEIASEHPLRRALSLESERLRSTVALLALLPRSRSGQPEPLEVGPLLDGVVALYHQHGQMRDTPLRLERGADVLPLWVDPSRLTHALLLLLASASGRAGAEVLLRYAGDAEYVTLRIETSGAAGNGGDTAASERVDPRAAEPLLRGCGGGLEVREGAEGRVCYEVRLPTLLEVRRREAAAVRL